MWKKYLTLFISILFLTLVIGFVNDGAYSIPARITDYGRLAGFAGLYFLFPAAVISILLYIFRKPVCFSFIVAMLAGCLPLIVWIILMLCGVYID